MVSIRNLNLDQNLNLKHSKKIWDGCIDFPDTNNISNDLETLLVNDLFIWKGNPLSQDYLRTLNEDVREEVAKDVYNYIKKYDWNKLQFNISDIKSAWKSLCKFIGKKEIKDNITYISNSASTGNKIYRHYFPNILKVAGEDRPSIYQGLTNSETLFHIIRNRVGLTLLYNDDPQGIPVQYPMNINLSQLSIGAKNSGLCSMASIFKPTVAKMIYDHYVIPGDKVLDYSCGFGTRLLGLMSLNKDCLYCGYEPNTETFNHLQRMIQDFSFSAEIKCSGSETDDLFDHKFNFIFSSPPYFTVEKYCDEETQCYIKYPEYDLWLQHYWKKTIQNCKKMLIKDGIFAVNIGGTGNQLMQQMADDMTKIVISEGFQLIDTWFMITSKSHLSGKKGKEEKRSKLEGIYFFKG